MRSMLKTLLRYFRPHMKLFLLDMFCAVLASAIDLAFPMVSRHAMYTLLPDRLFGAFFALMTAVAVSYAIRSVCFYVMTYWGHTFGARVEADIRADLFRHLQDLDFEFYDQMRTGNLMSRLTGDLFEITELAHHGPEDLLISSLTVVGAFIAMFFIEWRIALAMLLIMPFCVWFVMKARFTMKSTSKSVKEQTANINAGIESSISGARVAKAFANEEYEIAKFEEGNNLFLHAKDKFYKAMAVFNSGTEFFIALFNVVVLLVGGILIINKAGFSSITFITFMLYVSAFTSPLKRFASFFEQYMMGMAGFTRFLEILDTRSEITDREGAIEVTDLKGKIEFEDVSFAYEQGQNVLSNVNLTIEPGKKLALVGPSGGGKTTLCHLLMRFYDVTEGAIRVDGVDVRDYTQESLRRNIGIVQQDVFLFAGSVLENIRYGRLDATDEEVVQAAIRAHIHDEIMQFPDQYQTEVGERGVKLSGGQKQRISIARLFLKNPPILILDEATSALDTVTEYDIQKSFDDLSEGRTTLIIAHRLSTVRNADEIIVIDEQGIRERGSHDELVAQNGLYATFYRTTLRD